VKRSGWGVIAILIALWLLWMALRPNPTVSAELAPLTTAAATQGIAPYFLINILGNLGVFVPLGATLTLALGGSWRRRISIAVILGAGLSVSIELAQSQLATRVPSLGDWVLNTLGTLSGALIIRGGGYFWGMKEQ